jgi:hypothetical protein
VGRKLRLTAVALTAAVTALAAGCGGTPPKAAAPASHASHASQAAATSAAAPAGPITFTGTLTLTGADRASGTFTDTSSRRDPLGNVFASCSDWARHVVNGAPDAGVDFVNPGPQAPVGGHNIGIAFQVQGYHGPGTYMQRSPGVRAEISDGFDSFSNPASFALVVKPDGSGHVTFTGASGINGTSAAQKVSGSLTWTCR